MRIAAADVAVAAGAVAAIDRRAAPFTLLVLGMLLPCEKKARAKRQPQRITEQKALAAAGSGGGMVAIEAIEASRLPQVQPCAAVRAQVPQLQPQVCDSFLFPTANPSGRVVSPEERRQASQCCGAVAVRQCFLWLFRPFCFANDRPQPH